MSRNPRFAAMKIVHSLILRSPSRNPGSFVYVAGYSFLVVDNKLLAALHATFKAVVTPERLACATAQRVAVIACFSGPLALTARFHHHPTMW